MPGESKHPAQAMMLGIEAIKFAARPYATDTSKGGSPEWDADLRWLARFMEKVWEAAPEHTDGLHECLGTLAATALDLAERDALLPATAEITEALRLLAAIRDAFADKVVSTKYMSAIREIADMRGS